MPVLLAFILGSMLIPSGCQEVVELELPEGETRLVVDGTFSNLAGQQQILLSYTSPYFEEARPPAASGAQLIISDQNGIQDSLLEYPGSSGIYYTEKPGQIGNTYTLDIYLDDGRHYRSVPELLYEVSPIDSMYFRENLALHEEDEGYLILLDSKDPVGIKNFYRWKHFVDGVAQNEPFDLVIGFDEFTDGNSFIGFQINLNPVQLGDSVRAEQWSISESYYDYLFTLRQQTAFIGGLFDPPPASIKGNVVNVDDSDDYALGYFNVSAISAIEGVVE